MPSPLLAKARRAGRETAENALSTALARVDMTRLPTPLVAELADAEADIATQIRQSPVWREREQLLRSVPGIGPSTSSLLITSLPELGRATPRELAAPAPLLSLAKAPP